MGNTVGYIIHYVLAHDKISLVNAYSQFKVFLQDTPQMCHHLKMQFVIQEWDLDSSIPIPVGNISAIPFGKGLSAHDKIPLVNAYSQVKVTWKCSFLIQ